jgi:hypothetical protein
MHDFVIVDSLQLRSLSSESGNQKDSVPCSELLNNHVPTGAVVNGVILETAVRWHDCYVVILTDDIPYEESLHIYLLDANFRRLDVVELFAAYATGSFSALQLMPPDRLSFDFFGDARWDIELLPQPQWRLPFLHEPRGVSRPFGFFRRMIVRATPSVDRAQ